MATVRTARTDWTGDLASGQGTIAFESSHLPSTDVTWASRSQEANGRTSPEELIAAAHSSCFSMALSADLAKNGTPPESIETRADVTFDAAAGAVSGIRLTVRAVVPGLSEADFVSAAEGARTNCPVSKALAGTDITLDARLG
ncbi:OsmC family protein [Streptomyces meridianus]|uniref:OsmC family protein n=1 Tax=Streptomyces meridianus TaxID=2938945 RepID=A0ABT0XCC9_9ACTN|nr:OsmC family protein [Streptomyces meridianus]MCM2580079.1 OsmC family protein [Streptomyces meridianus]